jgi:long-chain acyl-CoA synthetase
MGGALEVKTDAEARPAGLRARTMCEAFQLTAAERPEQVALRTIGDGVSITFGEYAERVRVLAGGFHALGVRRGDTVGFMLTNRPEFHLLDTAAMHLGATPFSIYNTSAEDQVAYLLTDAGCRVVIVEAALLTTMQTAIERTDVVERTVLLDAEAAGTISFDQLESDGRAAGQDFDFDAVWRGVRSADVLTLIYTSGTTGPPKGVQLTHANELAECAGLHDATDWRSLGGSLISFLPNAHIADRGLVHYGQMIWGHTITTCPEPTQVFAHAIDARPTRFGSVPRMWEKLKAALEAGIAGETDAEKRAALEGA